MMHDVTITTQCAIKYTLKLLYEVFKLGDIDFRSLRKSINKNKIKRDISKALRSEVSSYSLWHSNIVSKGKSWHKNITICWYSMDKNTWSSHCSPAKKKKLSTHYMHPSVFLNVFMCKITWNVISNIFTNSGCHVIFTREQFTDRKFHVECCKTLRLREKALWIVNTHFSVFRVFKSVCCSMLKLHAMHIVVSHCRARVNNKTMAACRFNLNSDE